MKLILSSPLLPLILFSLIYVVKGVPEEIIQGIEDGHSSSGAAILSKQQGFAQASSHGGAVAFFRSGRPRAAAVRTFNEPYVGGDRTPHLRTNNQEGNYDHDLHTAYRLPLQRLSDRQLSMILKKYSHEEETRDGETTPDMSRVEMINQVQEKIIRKNIATKLIRPTLLTNINVLPEEVTIDNEIAINPKTNERTTVSSLIETTTLSSRQVTPKKKQIHRRSQKNIPELEAEEQQHETTNFSHSHNSRYEKLRQLTSTLRRVKAKYNSMKSEYLQRLREINERKISLAVATKSIRTTTTEEPETTTTTEESHLIDNEMDPKQSENTKIISTVVSTLIDNEPSESQENVKTHSAQLSESREESIISPSTKKTFIDNESAEQLETPKTKLHSTQITTLIDNDPSSESKEEIVVASASEKISTTGLIDNEPTTSESTEIISATTETSATTSRTEWEIKMINKLKTIVEKAKAQQHRIRPAEQQQIQVFPSSQEQKSQNTENNGAANKFMAPHAQIPRQYASKSVGVSHVPSLQPLGLHEGGNSEENILTESPPAEAPAEVSKGMVDNESHTDHDNTEEEKLTEAPLPKGMVDNESHMGQIRNVQKAAETEEVQEPVSVPKGMVDNESHMGGGFKMIMKKVGEINEVKETATTSEISTSELLSELSDELKNVEESSSTTEEVAQEVTEAPTTTITEEPTPTTTHETPEETSTQIIESTDEELDLFASTDEEAICDAISCDFEKGDLCQWEASQDELNPSSPHYHRHRVYRKAHFIRRSWHNWQGRYRNRVTGIARAQIFSFDNQRFAASYVRPFQRSTLTGKLLSGEKETIRFRAWEATRNVQIRVCCDNTENCVFETEIGVFRGSRRWRDHTATCPKGTTKIIFECINHGIYQGACGLDNIHLMNAYCPEVIPVSSLHDNERRRKKLI